MSCPLLTNMQAEAQNLGGRVALPSGKFLRVTPEIAMGVSGPFGKFQIV